MLLFAWHDKSLILSMMFFYVTNIFHAEFSIGILFYAEFFCYFVATCSHACEVVMWLPWTLKTNTDSALPPAPKCFRGSVKFLLQIISQLAK